MDALQINVSEHMNPAVYTVSISATSEEIDLEMSARGVSGLIVVDDDSRPVGVVTRTDLLARGRALHAPGGARSNKLNERLTARELFSADPVSISGAASLREAARLMAKRDVHRLMVVKGEDPVGMLSVNDLLKVVSESRIETPISEYASDTIAHVAPDDRIAYAMDRLQAAGVRGLVVMVDGWPVGSFAQVEALAAQDAGNDAVVEHWMNPGVVSIPETTPLHHAAAQAVAMHTPLIISLDDRTPKGVLTATDMLYALM